MDVIYVTHCISDKCRVIAVGSVPIASIEDANGVAADVRKRLEEADEAALVVELQAKLLVRLI